MLAIFWHTLKQNRRKIIVYVVAGFFITWMYVALFPTLKEPMQQLSESMKGSSDLMKAMGFDISAFGDFGGYMSSEWFGMIFPIMLIALTVSLGSSFFSGEIEKGTMEFLLSQPISRVKLFMGQLLSGIALVLTFVWVTVLLIFPLAKLSSISMNSGRFIMQAVLSSLFGLALLGLTVLFSAIFSEKGHVTMAVVGIAVVMYVVNIVANLNNSLNWLKYFSFFHYYDSAKMLVDGEIGWLTWIVLPGVFVIGSLLAMGWFNRRDIAI